MTVVTVPLDFEHAFELRLNRNINSSRPIITQFPEYDRTCFCFWIVVLAIKTAPFVVVIVDFPSLLLQRTLCDSSLTGNSLGWSWDLINGAHIQNRMSHIGSLTFAKRLSMYRIRSQLPLSNLAVTNWLSAYFFSIGKACLHVPQSRVRFDVIKESASHNIRMLLDLGATHWSGNITENVPARLYKQIVRQ